MVRTLLVTNDFPTREGGIESFVKALADRFPPGELVVYTASMPGDAALDATLPYPVIRDPRSMLLPTPAVRRRVLAAFDEHKCDRVLFGAAAPLGLLAPALREAGARRIVAITHGHEVWWARVPGTRALLRRISESVDVLTYISGWCHDHIAAGLRPAGRVKMARLAPGVEPDDFYPGCGGAELRARLGIDADVPLVVCAGRLVARKGQDTLIKAWPLVQTEVPGAQLLIVGKGPDRDKLVRLVERVGVSESVTLTGSVPQIPPYFDAADVFAMPSRDRHHGLEVEGLGIVYLEAAACAKPVVVGRSGGAPDAVQDGATGYVVDPHDEAEVADRIVTLLRDPALRARMGAAGREWVVTAWQWDAVAAQARAYLEA